MDRGDWQTTVHYGVTKSWTHLSTHTNTEETQYMDLIYITSDLCFLGAEVKGGEKNLGGVVYVFHPVTFVPIHGHPSQCE